MTQRMSQPVIAIDGQVRRPASASPGIRLYARITIRDAQGHIVKRGRWGRCHSYLKQFIQELCAWTRNTNVDSVTDTGNTSRTINHLTSASYSAWEAAAAITTLGPVAGTGSAAVAITDYALGALIAHGTGLGQMEYSATIVSEVSVSGSTASYTISRVLTNSSGASITVSEIGIYSAHRDNVGTQRFFCDVRDVSATGLPAAVAHSQTITVEFKIAVTA